MTRYKLGIDVGGTFTDYFLWESGGQVETFKVLSTPEDPSVAVLQGLSEVAESRGCSVGDFVARIDTIVHGTTVTTNAVLTRGGAKTGLLTTAGLRDALEMRRGIREAQYDNHCLNVVPLVPRRLRRPVGGRIDYKGREITELDLEDIRRATTLFREKDVRAVAICFMNSFANEEHELAARELLRSEMPDAYVSVSSELMPSIRFYNRVSTTVLNSYVGPILDAYLDNLKTRLLDAGFKGVLLIMQSTGGVALPEITAKRAANTLLSGPAAGPKAAVLFTARQGRKDCIVIDMGGTSFDASLVQDSVVQLETESDIDRLRIALPMLAIKTIGAGGGSIGWIDEGGLLRMGPKSAGALPGPASYGRGGELPTCTDADLVLGYLNPEFFAGGKLPLNLELAHAAILDHIARPLGISTLEAAAGMYRVINSNMAHGVRAITVERGLDPREFPLVVAGGAGALHACMIASDLGMTQLLIPAQASILCAVGMLQSDLQHDFVASYVCILGEHDPSRLAEIVTTMIEEGGKQLEYEGIPVNMASHHVSLDLRYRNQYHEVTVPMDFAAAIAGNVADVTAAFHERHDKLYGYNLADERTAVELINVRVRSLGQTDKPEIPTIAVGTADACAASKGRREAYVPESSSFEDMEVYDGHALQAGNVIRGPALIERRDTTMFVSKRFTATIDTLGSCLLQANKGVEDA